MITPALFFKYVEATRDGEAEGEDHGVGDMETGDTGHAVGSGDEGDTGHAVGSGDVTAEPQFVEPQFIEDGIGDEAHGGMGGDVTAEPQFVEPQFVEDGIGDEAHGGMGGDVTGVKGGDVGLGLQDNDARIEQCSDVHLGAIQDMGESINTVDQDNSGDNIGIQEPDFRGEATDFETGDREALEKKFEELWGRK